jgi:hypothetical protein
VGRAGSQWAHRVQCEDKDQRLTDERARGSETGAGVLNAFDVEKESQRGCASAVAGWFRALPRLFKFDMSKTVIIRSDDPAAVLFLFLVSLSP